MYKKLSRNIIKVKFDGVEFETEYDKLKECYKLYGYEKHDFFRKIYESGKIISIQKEEKDAEDFVILKIKCTSSRPYQRFEDVEILIYISKRIHPIKFIGFKA